MIAITGATGQQPPRPTKSVKTTAASQIVAIVRNPAKPKR